MRKPIIAVGLVCSLTIVNIAVFEFSRARSAEPAHHVPPPESAIPNDGFGDMVRLGRNIFTDPGRYAAPYVGNALKCSNCHLEAGRAEGSSPLAQAYVSYPSFRAKNGHVNTYEERLQGCFMYSMNGRAPPLGDKVLVALTAYSYFLAKGAPTGVEMPGRGYPKLTKPAQGMDVARGAAIFGTKCARCHGADGAGRMEGAKQIYPALWGPTSYNWGAGMVLIDRAAGFIKKNMPYGQGGSLSDQEAWDVATFVDSHERPQDPRFAGDVATTRKQFHDTPMSLYGTRVGNDVLGEHAVASGHASAPER